MEHRQFPYKRPAWWPENENWPPDRSARRQYWHSMRGRFFRRIGCGFLLLMLLAFGGFTMLFWLIASVLGLTDVPASMLVTMRTAGIIIITFCLFMLFFWGRELRRTAVPIGDMLDAASRIAEGDYDARVIERGPQEVRALARSFNRMTMRLQANDQQRRAFLAEITHELRTPITVIQGNLEGILDGIYPADNEHLGSILDETRVLSRLIDDLQTLSLADSGSLVLKPEPVNIGELITEVVHAFKGQAQASGIGMHADVQESLPQLEIDPIRIREVLSNILWNALHYTSSGGEIIIRGWSEKSDPEEVLVSVRDTGAGIGTEDLPYIFDRFYKTGDSKGSGLGLAIAKSLIEAHDGKISAESEAGQGTTIVFSLPV